MRVVALIAVFVVGVFHPLKSHQVGVEAAPEHAAAPIASIINVHEASSKKAPGLLWRAGLEKGFCQFFIDWRSVSKKAREIRSWNSEVPHFSSGEDKATEVIVPCRAGVTHQRFACKLFKEYPAFDNGCPSVSDVNERVQNTPFALYLDHGNVSHDYFWPMRGPKLVPRQTKCIHCSFVLPVAYNPQAPRQEGEDQREGGLRNGGPRDRLVRPFDWLDFRLGVSLFGGDLIAGIGAVIGLGNGLDPVGLWRRLLGAVIAAGGFGLMVWGFLFPFYGLG